MTTPAQKLQLHIKACLESEGWYCNKTISMSRAGFPDVIAVSPMSETYYWEVKAGKDRLSALQIHTIDMLNRGRTVAFVCRTKEEFDNQFNDLLKSLKKC